MSFDPESNERLELKLENQYQSIFDELTAIFDRYTETETTDFELRYSEMDINVRKVSKILSEYWNIPIDLVVSDFNEEIIRKKENQMEIPDVPTYQIRFALEEGSWIVLLRVNLFKLLKSHFSRLLTLEEIIFKTGKGIDDDCAYYLIEIDQISRHWISTYGKYWVSEHEFSKDIDSTIRCISAIYSVHIDRGKDIYSGSIRLMASKMSVLSRVNGIETNSNWALKAKSVFEDLKNQLNKEKYSREVLNLFVALSILQKEIIQIESIKTEETHKEETLQYLISEKIGWYGLDLSDEESVEYFSDNLLFVLYDLPHSDPITAVQYLLSKFFIEIDINDQIGSKYTELLNAKLEMRSEKYLELENRDKQIVEVIEEFLPAMFIQIKNEIAVSEIVAEPSKFEQITKSDMWANFEAQLQRIKRIDSTELSNDTFKRVIKSNYNLLISEFLSPMETIELMVSNFISIFSLENKILDEITNKAKSILEESKDKTISMVVVDQNLNDLLFSELQIYII
ncbi:MAG: hypothetical protein HeimC2_23940 [Candidatus Heimdallarchaeota archaeon LC_2]|nr:MAG: hypothetical protein HeimC2_23940 [Candidatus Heimdallarchaeota archaeon LC_2]